MCLELETMLKTKEATEEEHLSTEGVQPVCHDRSSGQMAEDASIPNCTESLDDQLININIYF